MTRVVRVVGIGAGDPEHLTVGAIRALRRTDVIFFVDKGDVAAEMRSHRQAVLDEVFTDVIGREQPRIVERTLTPVRDRDRRSYDAGVAGWRAERLDTYAELIDELDPDESGAFLVWGDPTLYDGTLAILDDIATRLEVEIEVVPGISSVSALAARHGIALNRIGESIELTTGRRLLDGGFPADADNVVVMLDAHMAWRQLDDDLHIWWGAFVGMDDEILVAGPLGEVRAEIEERRAAARDQFGWVFDTYLLRRVST
ncbi:MAG: precorrin-6A synthase (deacetylating) [Actinomycetota bacterium]